MDALLGTNLSVLVIGGSVCGESGTATRKLPYVDRLARGTSFVMTATKFYITADSGTDLPQLSQICAKTSSDASKFAVTF